MTTKLLIAAVAFIGTFAQAQTVTFTDTHDDSTATNGTCQDYCSATSAPDPANPNRLVVGFGFGNQGSCTVGGFSANCWSDQAFHVGAGIPFLANTRSDRICTTITAVEGEQISRIVVGQFGGGTRGARGGSFSGSTTVHIDNTLFFLGNAFSVSTAQDLPPGYTRAEVCVATTISATNVNFVNGRRVIIGSAEARISSLTIAAETEPLPEPIPTEPAR